ncbi:CatB-related O-acetyltransferase [Streptomyces sp. NPDC021100]|uniref:CatB-related O-acetyltransferase n=1 Tax=Streptomyces sp. NPDC021100 TaxID=3365114 RepID=UPI00378D8E02
MNAPIPDPATLHPLPGHDRVVLLRPLVADPRIEVGEYTYYDDPDGAAEFERRNVLYGYGPERLVIGKYCAIAAGTRFLMAGAAHPTMGVSTFPFTMFGGAWAERTLDLVTGMPGVRIGDGAVIAAGSVVTADVEPYTVAGGNPARPIRRRYEDADVERLVRASWWDWPVESVTEHVRTIMAGTPADIERIARRISHA